MGATLKERNLKPGDLPGVVDLQPAWHLADGCSGPQ
ncbi:MAG: hypothetical protein QOH96_3687 [Blastocatellia bacterium]|nr:hypothetical protein [Blastocatellia bacterium]